MSTSVESPQSAAVNRKPEREKETPSSPEEGKIYGRTPDGTVFVVPHTEDMVSNLLDPRIKKSTVDLAIVAILVSYVLLYFVTPRSLRIPVFVVMFALWRLAYNVGIGWLLSQQSHHRQLTRWAQEYCLFDAKYSKGFIQSHIRRDLQMKLAHDPNYDIDKAPLEFNTWLVFRSLVDLILMSDFTCYCLLGFACMSSTNNPWIIFVGRWVAGVALIVFNLWVKLDAHRVVKDYAWYWGDFFFLEDLQLTFDGVFEMAPHPMYSIGYAGYYGACLLTASYTFFFCSVIAHACQFAFLILVENPHIEKTYNPPPPAKKPVRKLSDVNSLDSPVGSPGLSAASLEASGGDLDDNSVMHTSRPAMLLFKNFNVTRASDILTALVTVYCAASFWLPSNGFWYLVTFFSALFWRLFHNFGLGFILHKQSEKKLWTRIFLKFGRTTLEAYEQWQVLYNMTTILSHVTFGVFVLRQWTSPIGVAYWPFKYILGAMLISLQMWTSWSVYESLGEYGWFFGDFFFPRPQRLTYSGIYRYLNNPERLFGIAGVWGAALLSSSYSVIILAFFWTYGGMAFIRFVEQPHMQKLYGNQIREDSGVTKTIRQATKLPQPLFVKQLQGSVDKIINEAADAIEAFLGHAKPKITTGVRDVVKDTKVLLKETPARLTIVRVSDEIKVDPSKYSLEIATPAINAESDNEIPKFEFGTPLRVKWTADANRSKKDWIGLYRVTAGKSSTEVTKISSRGRWTGVDSTGYNDHVDGVISCSQTEGEVEFHGDALFWEEGVYELRYHHDGKHNVLALTQPFAIVCTKVEVESVLQVGSSLLSLVQRCCDHTGVWPPASTDETWAVNENPRVISRLAYGIEHIYGVDLAAGVLATDETVGELANRLISIRDALEPFTSTKELKN
ncbi:phosphatidylethanolamine N-methyltransferase [Trichomonascus vanleenenianus]|uniref:phosphatidylethanolamine N-methyltransferase n=1 Tax=Trichomonascus vanleenenianus TaxID=2268995 RepID=UPI003EC9598D